MAKKLKLKVRALKGRKLNALLLVVLVLGSVLSSVFFKAEAAQLTSRSLLITSSTASEINVSYRFSFTLVTAGTLGSIVLELCSNDPFPGNPCTPPPGLDMTAATLVAQAGEIGFGIDGSSTANRIVLTRTPAAAAIGSVSYNFDGVTNPSANGTFYGRIMTYASNDGTGGTTDEAGIAWAINNQFLLNTEVPQFLEFCTGIIITGFDCLTALGSYINFGILSSAGASAATSQMVAATNAPYGYNVGIYGLTMTSGSNVIPALGSQTFSAPGNNQFGLNAVANSSPAMGNNVIGPGVANVSPEYSLPDLYRFNNGDLVASSPGTSDYRKYTLTYITNVSSGQSAGKYTTTLTYICLANF